MLLLLDVTDSTCTIFVLVFSCALNYSHHLLAKKRSKESKDSPLSFPQAFYTPRNWVITWACTWVCSWWCILAAALNSLEKMLLKSYTTRVLWPCNSRYFFLLCTGCVSLCMSDVHMHKITIALYYSRIAVEELL